MQRYAQVSERGCAGRILRPGPILRLRSPGFAGLIAHVDNQFTTIRDVMVQKISFGIGLPIERHPLDINIVATIISDDDMKRLAVRQRHRRFVNYRTAEHIGPIRRINRVEAQRREDVPGRQLPHVFVTTQAIGFVGVQIIEDLPNFLGCFGGLAT